MRARSILRGIVSGLLFAAWGGAAGAADIRVLATAAVRGAFETLIPQFERASGYKASVVYGASAGLKTRIDGGEAFDVCVLTGAQIDDLVKQTKVVGSRVDLARSGVALGVRSSAPTADVSSDDKLRAYLLAVRSIEIGNPAGGGFSSVYFTQTLAELGIADALKARIRNSTLNEGIARVSRGEADLTAGMMSEIVPVKELKALQYRASNAGAYLEYAAGGKAGDAAQALVFFLGTQGSKAVFAAQGMEPR